MANGTFIISNEITIEIVGNAVWINDFILDKNEAEKLANLILAGLNINK